MKFLAPSKIQETALPVLLADPPQNMIAQSQSGTGKTAAFALTMLSRVNTSKLYPQCLCLAPTYELALQIGDVIRQMGKHIQGLGIKYAVRGERGMSVREVYICKRLVGRLKLLSPGWLSNVRYLVVHHSRDKLDDTYLKTWMTIPWWDWKTSGEKKNQLCPLIYYVTHRAYLFWPAAHIY